MQKQTDQSGVSSGESFYQLLGKYWQLNQNNYETEHREKYKTRQPYWTSQTTLKRNLE